VNVEGLLVVLVLVLIAGVVLQQAWRRNRDKEREHFVREGDVTTARVVAVWQDLNGGGDGEMLVTFRFLPKGGGAPVVQTEQADNLFRRLPREGDVINVAYDHRDPQKVRIVPEPRTFGDGAL